MALFNWLYAKKLGGQFLLRIEDTDLERSEDIYTQDILASMKWLGLNWDEEPIFQSKRMDVYRKKVEELIGLDHAYRCYCTEAEVEAMREKATLEGKKPQYDRRCRDLHRPAEEGKPFVIRAKIPLEGKIEFTDLIRGHIQFENIDLDDFVLIRSSGAPTYNLSVVVDDVHSRMTHILRGDDHINNTPKQMHLYQFFKYPVPQFAHLPMILGADKKKLSKRHGAVSANLYREEGYLPEALLNFLARLGWSHGDQEIFSIAELCEFFSFDHVQKSAAVFNLEKLLWLNGSHIRTAAPERLLKIVTTDFAGQFSADALVRANTRLGEKLVALIQPKVKLLKELAEQLVPLCTPGVPAIAAEVLLELKWQKNPALKPLIKAAVIEAIEFLGKKIAASSGSGDPKEQSPGAAANSAAWAPAQSLADLGFTHTEIDAYLRQLGEKHTVKLGDLTQPMRLAVTGRMISAGLFDLLAILPWDLVAARLKNLDSF